MTQLKDYLHLYIGCEYACLYDGEYNYHGDKLTYTALYKYSGNFIIGQRFKLILRPLSDMTEKEKSALRINVFQACAIDEPNEDVMWTFEQTRNLLSKYFDIFSLIEAGLAIDKTKI